MAQRVENLHALQETQVPSLGQEDSLKKGIATHSSFLVWKIPQRSLVGHYPRGHKELDMNE